MTNRHTYKDKPKHTFSSLIDYVSGTLDCPIRKDVFEVIFPLCDKEDWAAYRQLCRVKVGNFFNGNYTKMIIFENMRIYCDAYCGKNELGEKQYENIEDLGRTRKVYIQFGGQAIRDWMRYSKCNEEESDTAWDINHIIHLWKHNSFKATRIDSALDDYKKALDLNVVRKKGERGHFISKIKTFTPHLSTKDFDEIGTENRGITLYFGSPQSDFRIRFYDKKAERVAKRTEKLQVVLDKLISKLERLENKRNSSYYPLEKEDLGIEINKLDKKIENIECEIDKLNSLDVLWQRYELQLRRDYSELFLRECYKIYTNTGSLVTNEELGTLIHSMIISNIRLVDKPKNSLDTIKSRWKTNRMWHDFSKGIGIEKRVPERITNNLLQRMNIFIEQQIPSYELYSFLARELYNAKLPTIKTVSFEKAVETVEVIQSMEYLTIEERSSIIDEFFEEFEIK